MKIDTTYYERCISTLQKAYELLRKADRESIDYDMYSSACVKEYEIILEQSGKLLRKVLNPYFHSSKAVDQLYFKEVFRHAVLRSIITDAAAVRWMEYRDSRNNTTHDYGVNFAEEIIALLPHFIIDAQAVAEAVKSQDDVAEK